MAEGEPEEMDTLSGNSPSFFANMDIDAVEENPDEEDSFIWQDYLDVTNSTEVPNMLFSHVEQSLMNGLEEGMTLEVPLKDPKKFWLASIVMACGPLLRMKYVGQSEDRTGAFWCDLTKIKVHPVGWCKAQGINLTLPDELHDLADCDEVVEKALREMKHAPAELLTGDGLTPIDRIKQGMKLEVQSTLDPRHLWVATIIESVGGRLLMRYDTPGTAPADFWVFYNSSRLFRMGWVAEQGKPWFLQCPPSMKNQHSIEEWDAVMEMTKEDNRRVPLPPDLFQHKTMSTPHTFQVGMKLEAVHPVNLVEFCPASVVKVFDSHYFLVQIDSYTRDEIGLENMPMWLCTKQHPYIFPVGWTQEHDLQLSHPHGWTNEFDWSVYLCACKSIAAPKSCFSQQLHSRKLGFKSGMKLEAVNPENQHQICAATISKMCCHLLWISLESNDSDHPCHIVSHDSTDIFPVGWCETNNYQLVPPRYYQVTTKQLAAEADSEPKEGSVITSSPPTQRSSWCPKIYFNHKCFSGPFLSKGKLAQLPKAVGPGPVTLVMHEVLAMLISVAYISSRVLKVLQVEGRPERGTHLEILKAKHKGNTYRANVAVVTSADKVSEFCKDVCKRLQVCPQLFGPTPISENNCPEKCNTLSKTRFNLCLFGSNKQGRPKGCISNIVRTGFQRKRKQRKHLFTSMKWRKSMAAKKNENNGNETNPIISREEFASLLLLADGHGSDASNESGNTANTVPTNSSINSASGIKRKYKKRVIPHTSDIKTRGAQLPKYSNHWHRQGGWKRLDLMKHPPNSTASTTTSEHTSVTDETNPARGASNQPLAKKKKERANKADKNKIKLPKYPNAITLETNPLQWTEKDVFTYLTQTDDCGEFAEICREELIDGHAFMLLNLPTIQEDLHLKMADALKLCYHVEQVKMAFYIQFGVKNEP